MQIKYFLYHRYLETMLVPEMTHELGSEVAGDIKDCIRASAPESQRASWFLRVVQVGCKVTNPCCVACTGSYLVAADRTYKRLP